jgi:predicted KAP-like P-loop ATPase
MARKRASWPALVSDVPLDDPKRDRLGRAPFARSLAKSITAFKGTDSFVVGIYGPWGSGKSSVLNFLIRELDKKKGKKKPVVLRFNPWIYTGRQQLLHAFLLQLGATIGRSDKSKGPKRAAEMLERFSIVLRPLSLIPGAGELAKVAQDTADAAASKLTALADKLGADLEGIKAEINALLVDLRHRIVIIMDDIDRL